MAADVYLNAMPLFHIGGLAFVLASLTAGGQVLCMSTFAPSAVKKIH